MHKDSKVPGTLGSVGSDHYYRRYCLIAGNRPWKRQGLFSFSVSCLGPQFQEHFKLEMLPKEAVPLLFALCCSLPSTGTNICFHVMYQIRELIVSHLPPKRWLLTPINCLIQFPAQWQNTCVSGKYVVVKWAASDVEKGGAGFFLAANVSLNFRNL